MAEKYTNWSVDMLKNELRKHNAKLSGRKQELIDRLVAYDFNFATKNNSETVAEYKIRIPSAELYKDVNNSTQVPTVSQLDIEEYMTQCNSDFVWGKSELYSAHFIQFLRCAKDDEKFYFKSQCRAEMRKTTVYNIDIVCDDRGVVMECQCECAAGMGPMGSCKHIFAALLCLQAFCTTGTYLSEATCTEKLQTFHKTKKYIGSPLKANALPLLTRVNKNNSTVNLVNALIETQPSTSSTVSSQPVSTLSNTAYTYDPRPPAYRQNPAYEAHVRNVTLNYACNKDTSEFPLLHLYEPANPYGIENDHQYQSEKITDHLLNMLHIQKYDENYATSLEQATKEQAKSQRWKEERCHRLHASHFGRICKATDKTDKVKFAESLTQITDIKSAAITHGRNYESAALGAYEQMYDCKVDKVGIIISKSHPFIAASPDGMVGDIVIEVKCPYSAKHRTINNVSVPYLVLVNNNNDDLMLDKKHDYFYQIQGQLFVTEKKLCHFVVFTLTDIKVITIARDEAFINSMVFKLTDFFNQFFKLAILNKYFYKNYNKYSFSALTT